MTMGKMRLQAEVNVPPYVDGDRIKVGVTVKDAESGRAWSMQTELTQGNGTVFSEKALPFDVLKQAEDALFDYLMQREVTTQLRVLREQVIPHTLGTAYRPVVATRKSDGKIQYFLKG
jgi:hypothetical protein